MRGELSPLRGLGVMVAGLAIALCGCASYPPLPTVEHVDLPRFMGDWYVIAHIPAPSEADAFNGVESYRLEEDGTIATTYAFRRGAFDGPVQVMQPTGVVWNTETNATWGMQFFWPFRFEYLITYLDEEYSTTIVARTARDYAWIMARSPNLPDARYLELATELERQGYDTAHLRRLPQRWPDAGHPANESLR
ncbi:MAG: lipocalin family protein [Planctomycetota bacterium]